MDQGQLPLIALRPAFAAALRSLLAMTAGVSFALAATTATAEIWSWKDSQGRVHFGDRDPGKGAARVTEQAARPQERIDIRLDDPDGVLDAAARENLESGIRRVFDVYTGLFHLAMRRPVVIDISLFGSRARLSGWLAGVDPQFRGELPPGIYGLYLQQYNRIGAWRHDSDSSRVVATLIHEASHVMLAQLAPDAPAWLQEGMAQYFSGIDVEDDRVRILPAPQAAAAIDIFVRHERLVTLRRYFDLDEREWRHLAHVQQNPVPYSVAWSICYFLMGKPVGRQIIGELLQDMEKAKRLPTPDAIEKRYPGGYAVMEYDWFSWAQKPKVAQTLTW